MSVIRWVVRRGGSTNRWLASLVARKPRMVAAVALANKMARMVWAMTTTGEDYKIASSRVARRWNAPTEVVRLLGYDYPVFRRTEQWLESERNPKISC
jgi:hypothetical protein